jgi:hypothetical protein
MEEKTECKWCGVLTCNLDTEECDRCWELRFRIAGNPALALKILQSLGEKESANTPGADRFECPKCGADAQGGVCINCLEL